MDTDSTLKRKSFPQSSSICFPGCGNSNDRNKCKGDVCFLTNPIKIYCVINNWSPMWQRHPSLTVCFLCVTLHQSICSPQSISPFSITTFRQHNYSLFNSHWSTCWLGHGCICYPVGDVSVCGHYITDERTPNDTVQQSQTSTFTIWMLLKALCFKPMGFFSAMCPIHPSVSGGQSFCSDWTQGDWSSRSEMSLEGIFSPWDDWLLHRD